MIGKQSPESLGCSKVNRIYFSAGSAIYTYGIYLVHQFLHDFIISWAQNYEKIWYLSTTSGSNPWASYSEAQEPFSQRIHLLSGISPTSRCTELLLNIINPIIRFSQIIRLLETLPAFSITINKDDLYLIILQEL